MKNVRDVEVLEVEHMSKKIIRIGDQQFPVEYFYTEVTNKDSNKWMALICVNRENKYLGRYPSFEEAKNARKQAEEKYYGEYSYDNSMREGEKFGDLSYIP